ncbi:hypothetical protein F2Q68_00038841 [Brassica cretica]|uniref:Uncharacterized protein n=1 Tax=Brassica cretica TaxID=69181 RepID=A0A8S9MDR8_BRACR|nr:hypothetical protein F2Q68_00038841 [Brassica cretica]
MHVYRTIADPKSRVEIVCAEQVVSVYARQAMMMLRNVSAYAACTAFNKFEAENRLSKHDDMTVSPHYAAIYLPFVYEQRNGGSLVSGDHKRDRVSKVVEFLLEINTVRITRSTFMALAEFLKHWGYHNRCWGQKRLRRS